MKAENKAAVESLESSATSKSNFRKYRSKGKMNYMQKKTTRAMRNIHMVGKRLRKQGMDQEKKFGNIVFQIQKPPGGVDLKSADMLEKSVEKAENGTAPIGDPFDAEHPD